MGMDDAKNEATEADGRMAPVAFGDKVGISIVSALFLVFVVGKIMVVDPAATALIRELAQGSVFAAFLLAFTNGANDIANSVGTSVGSKAMSLQNAIAAGVIFESLGGLFVGPLVSNTISHGIIDLTSYERTPNALVKIMFSSILGSGLSTLGATAYGVPVSATKGVITSMVVLALMTEGSGALNLEGLSYMVLTFIISPISGLLGAYLLNAVILKTIVMASSPVAAAKAYRPLIFGITVSVSTLSLVFKGPMAISPAPLAFLAAIAIGGICGLVAQWYWKTYGEDRKDIELNEPKKATKDAVEDQLNETFSPLVVLSGFVVAFAHGGNDVSNASGPLSIVAGYALKPDATSMSSLPKPYWTIGLATLGFACGIIVMGEKSIRVVGCKLAKQTASKAFATQFGAACTILVASILHQTVSTSHVLVGAVVGASIAERHWTKKDVKVNYSVLLKIVVGWVVTIPIAGGIAVTCYYTVSVFSGVW